MGVLSQQHTRYDALIVQAVSDALNVPIHINESIEGWATVTGIRPISRQQGTTAVSAVQLDYYKDNISGYEISSVTNVNNYLEVIID